MIEEGEEESAEGNMETSMAMTGSTDRSTIEFRMVNGRVVRTNASVEVVAETAVRMTRRIDSEESQIRAPKKNQKSKNQFFSTRKKHSSSEMMGTK
jgi:hypothetical protein